MNIEMDGFINRLICHFLLGAVLENTFRITICPSKKPTSFNEAGERVNSVKYGIKIGHSVFNNHSVNFYPYFSIGGYKMMSASPVVDTDASVIKNILTHSFYSGIGASCDVALKKWKSKNPYEPEG
jgi:hypothetical protein